MPAAILSMVLEAKASDGAKTDCAGNGGGAAAERHTVSAAAWGARMPYIFVRENAIKYWCTVQGLNHNEVSGPWVVRFQEGANEMTVSIDHLKTYLVVLQEEAYLRNHDEIEKSH
jgi:hypothetical protein